MARRTLEEISIWPAPPREPRRSRSLRTFAGLGVIVLALALSFIIRDLCWEAVAFSAIVSVVVTLIGRFRDVLLTVGIVVVTVLGLLVVEGVSVYTFHSVIPFGTPRTIMWCGQELAPQGDPFVVRSNADFQRLSDGRPAHAIGVTPDGSAIVVEGPNGWTGCPFQLAVALGNDRWQLYMQDPF